VVKQDLSVEDSAKNLLQIIYGKDGMDATYLTRFDLPLLEMNNMQLCDEYDSLPYLYEILWPLEQSVPSSQSPYRSIEELGRLLISEVLLLKKYRDLIRSHRLHYDPMQMDKAISVPANIKSILKTAATKQHKRYRAQKKLKSDNGQVLSASVLFRLVESAFERLYSYYPGFFNRLWCFEALIFSELSIKNVLVNYRFDYESIEFILAEIERQFVKAIADPEEAVGMLASQSAGQLYTQKSLDSHRGGNDIEEGGSINVFQELINLTEDPKNPQMIVYPLSLEELQSLFQPEFIQKCIFRNNKVTDAESSKVIAQFLADELVCRYLSDITCAAPRLVMESDLTSTVINEDEDWLSAHMALLSPKEKAKLSTRSPIVLRFVLDAGKCSYLHMTPYDIVHQIRRQLKELKLGQEASNETTSELGVEEDMNNFSLFGSDKDQDLIAIVSPTLSFSHVAEAPQSTNDIDIVVEEEEETEQTSYWILRLYVSRESKYYKQFAESKEIMKNEVKLMKKLMQFIHGKTYIHGIKNVTAAAVREDLHREVDEKTGTIIPVTKHVVVTRGTNLMDTLGLPFVDDVKTHSTHLPESKYIWGIEAAANCLNRALAKSLVAHGDYINDRHLEQVVKTISHRKDN
jgi:hypothetical protein